MTEQIQKLQGLLRRIDQRLHELDNQVHDSALGDLHGLVGEALSVANTLQSFQAFASGRVNQQPKPQPAFSGRVHDHKNDVGRSLGKHPPKPAHGEFNFPGGRLERGQHGQG